MFGDGVGRALTKYEGRAHAFCWMTNHVHLLLEVGHAPVNKYVHHFATNYVRRFNRRHDLLGHLFMRRYHCKAVTTDAYIIALLRYIHRNPVEASLVRHAHEYPWSSMRSYLAWENVPWLTTKAGLSLLNSDFGLAQEALKELVGVRDPDFDPWVLDRDRQKTVVDPAAKVAGGGAEGALHSFGAVGDTWQHLDAVVAAGCKRFRTTEAALVGRNRSRSLAIARAWVATEAARVGVASIAEVARRFGRSRSTLSESMRLLDELDSPKS